MHMTWEMDDRFLLNFSKLHTSKLSYCKKTICGLHVLTRQIFYPVPSQQQLTYQTSIFINMLLEKY